MATWFTRVGGIGGIGSCRLRGRRYWVTTEDHWSNILLSTRRLQLSMRRRWRWRRRKPIDRGQGIFNCFLAGQSYIEALASINLQNANPLAMRNQMQKGQRIQKLYRSVHLYLETTTHTFIRSLYHPWGRNKRVDFALKPLSSVRCPETSTTINNKKDPHSAWNSNLNKSPPRWSVLTQFDNIHSEKSLNKNVR